MKHLILAMCLILTATGCSVIKKEDPEQKVRVFLTTFQSDLPKADDVVLDYFHVKQTQEAVLSAINILRDKHAFVACETNFANAQISFEQELIKVETPVTFRLKDMSSEDAESFTFTLWLTPDNDSFIITQLDGEGLFQAFSSIKNRNAWEAEQKLAREERLWIYENARTIEGKYDSVIWYSTYRDENYFYVVDGDWTNYFLNYNTKHQRNSGTHMGLVDAKGEIIIPIEYDLVGAIGFEEPYLVEVRKDGKVGYFDIGKKQLVVDTRFDLIIPCGREKAWAIVKQDTAYGWLDREYNYQSGFPSARIQKWTEDFEFLKRSIRLKAGEQIFCEIPSAEHTGSGIIVPPSYLSQYGIFDEIEGGISTTSVPISAWTEYKETKGSFMETITSNIMAVVTTVQERYLEGREEFYTSNQLLFVNQNHDTLRLANISGEEISMHTIDSGLLEVRTPHDFWFAENNACEEYNLYHHDYFAITEGSEVTQLKSNRLYPQTQYVKLDSTYLQGSFRVYTADGNENSTTFLSITTISYMRDEILASYGYRFPEQSRVEQFQQRGDWYVPHHDKVEEIEAEMTDIDRHNLAFLNKILSLMKPSTAA